MCEICVDRIFRDVDLLQFGWERGQLGGLGFFSFWVRFDIVFFGFVLSICCLELSF